MKYKWFVALMVVVLGTIFALTKGPLKGMKITFEEEAYAIIDINLDHGFVSSEVISEGFAMGNNLFTIESTQDLLSDDFDFKEDCLLQKFERVEEDPRMIVLIRIKGTTPIDSLWIGGLAETASFSMALGSHFKLKKNLHFFDVDNLNGWNYFSEGPASCCSNHFELQGFFRMIPTRDKGDARNQYKLQPVAPDPKLAAKSIKLLETNKYLNQCLKIDEGWADN